MASVRVVLIGCVGERNGYSCPARVVGLGTNCHVICHPEQSEGSGFFLGRAKTLDFWSASFLATTAEKVGEPSAAHCFFLSSPLAPLVCLSLCGAIAGFVFGNPEFFRYNVQATMQPLRVLLALGLRLWQVVGYLNLSFLTLAGLFAMWLPPLHDNGEERKRISLEVQFAFLAVIKAYVVAMAVVGGAVLARYMLPVVPLVIILWVSTLRRRVRLWRDVVAIVALAFVAGSVHQPQSWIFHRRQSCLPGLHSAAPAG